MDLNRTPNLICINIWTIIFFLLSPFSQLKEKFKEYATRFFISILTNLTFKSLEAGAQNTDLVTLLMGFVTLDEEGISQLLTDKASINLFTKDGLDPSPAFRTFLLQLLIKHR